MDNIKLPSVTTHEKMPPLVPMLSRPVSDELRKILAAQPIPQSEIDGLPGLLIAMVLLAEGQTKPAMPSVGGVIVDRAKELNRPITALLARHEVEALQKPVDLVALNKAIDENVIAFMLEARQRFGPIGGYCETLYRERKGEELYMFVKSLAERGVPEMGMFLEGDAAREMFVARLPVALASHASSPPTFCLLPIGVLTGPGGLLSAFSKRGMRISALA